MAKEWSTSRPRLDPSSPVASADDRTKVALHSPAPSPAIQHPRTGDVERACVERNDRGDHLANMPAKVQSLFLCAVAGEEHLLADDADGEHSDGDGGRDGYAFQLAHRAMLTPDLDGKAAALGPSGECLPNLSSRRSRSAMPSRNHSSKKTESPRAPMCSPWTAHRPYNRGSARLARLMTSGPKGPEVTNA